MIESEAKNEGRLVRRGRPDDGFMLMSEAQCDPNRPGGMNLWTSR
jgi:hypothetical protein